ncbi:hypothetical protein [Phenylobacterium sp.]
MHRPSAEPFGQEKGGFLRIHPVGEVAPAPARAEKTPTIALPNHGEREF